MPSSIGEGGPLKKKFESFECTGEDERSGEFPGLENVAISDPESGVGGKLRNTSSAENRKDKNTYCEWNHTKN